jgi:predicted ester cyclase
VSGDGERLARALHAAYNAHDAGAAAALYAAEGRHVEIATGGARSGPAAIAAGLAGLLAAFPDAHWEAAAFIASGDRVAVPYLLTGTLQTPFGPFEPAGQQLALAGVHVVRAGDGAIVACDDYWDAGTFGRQMRPPAEAGG